MKPPLEGRIASSIRCVIQDGAEELFGEGARIELPAGRTPNDFPTSFSIVTQDGDVFVVEVEQIKWAKRGRSLVSRSRGP